MTGVTRLFGLEGARHAVGATVVIDTFRAFSTAAFLIDAGVTELLLADTLDEARLLAASRPGALLCGEDGGRRPPDFDLGNSPGEVVASGRLDGTTAILRTSGGTRCVRAAVTAGARPVFAASLVVSAATFRALSGHAAACVVAAGRAGIARVGEDDATADYLEALLTRGSSALPNVSQLRSGEPGTRLRTASWAHPDDLDLCLEVDRFDFAMRSDAIGAAVRLAPVPR